MDVTPNAVAARANWAEVRFLRIYKNSLNDQQATAYIFNNTRQQCVVHVAFTAYDGSGNPVTLSDGEARQAVRLIRYNDGTTLPGGDDFTAHPEWLSSFTSQGYEWDENVIGEWMGLPLSVDKAVDGEATPRVQILSFYVSTSSKTPLSIAAMVQWPSGAPLAKTNDHGVVDPDGNGDGHGRFNSAVIVHPVSPVLSISDYTGTADGSLQGTVVGDTSNFYKIYEYAVGVRIAGRDTELRSVSSSPQGNSGFGVRRHSLTTTMKWSISYYGQPKQYVPEHFPLPPLHHLDINVRSTATPSTEHAHRGAVHVTNLIDLGDGTGRRDDITVVNEVRYGSRVSSRDDATLRTYDPVQMFNDCGGRIFNASPYKVIIGLLAGNIDGRFLNASNVQVPDELTDTFYVMDAYGNQHSLVLAYDGTDPLRLKLSKGFRNEEHPRGGTRASDPKFTVTVDHPAVYRNDRQQARLTFSITVGDGPLSDQEIDSIRVIDYDTGRPIPFADDGPDRHNGWSAQRSYRGYNFMNGTQERPDADGEYFYFYVAADHEAARGPLYLGLSIVLNGTTYRSNGWETAPDGKETYRQGRDTARTKVVDSVEPEKYALSNFVLEGNEPPSAGIFDLPVKLSLIGSRGAVGIRTMSCTPAGMGRWASAEALNPCCAGYASPGETAVRWPPYMPMHDLPSELVSAERDKGVFMVCGRVGIPWDNDVPKGPMSVSLIDANGSDQACRLHFVDGERGRLRIA